MRLRGLYAPGSADREALDGALRRLDAGEDPRTAPRRRRPPGDPMNPEPPTPAAVSCAAWPIRGAGVVRAARPAGHAAALHVGPACLMSQRVECRLCAEACDTRAVRAMPALGGVMRLRLDLSACTGYGDCLAPAVR